MPEYLGWSNGVNGLPAYGDSMWPCRLGFLTACLGLRVFNAWAQSVKQKHGVMHKTELSDLVRASSMHRTGGNSARQSAAQPHSELQRRTTSYTHCQCLSSISNATRLWRQESKHTALVIRCSRQLSKVPLPSIPVVQRTPKY